MRQGQCSTVGGGGWGVGGGGGGGGYNGLAYSIVMPNYGEITMHNYMENHSAYTENEK